MVFKSRMKTKYLERFWSRSIFYVLEAELHDMCDVDQTSFLNKEHFYFNINDRSLFVFYVGLQLLYIFYRTSVKDSPVDNYFLYCPLYRTLK